MILLLGKDNAVVMYTKEILKMNVDELVYYPPITTHYTDFPKYINLIKKRNPSIITTQNLELIEVLLNSNLDFKVITAYINNDGEIKERVLTKIKAKRAMNEWGIELR